MLQPPLFFDKSYLCAVAPLGASGCLSRKFKLMARIFNEILTVRCPVRAVIGKSMLCRNYVQDSQRRKVSDFLLENLKGLYIK